MSETSPVDAPDYDALRTAIANAEAMIEVSPLGAEQLHRFGWSGSPTHLENVAVQLDRVGRGEVVYLAIFANGHAVAKGGIDFAKEPGAGTIWQLATHRQLEGLGLATRLIRDLEARALDRGIHRLRLGVEPDNDRARKLYEHLGYWPIGESEASWGAERADGSRFIYTTAILEMLKVV